MSLLLIITLTLAVLTAGYLLYGSFIARFYRLDDAATTPAVRNNDGVEFVPTNPFYLMGQHFSAIAAAGPIVGPIAACAAFGWLPCLLWILLGVVLIGAVHDFSALIASVRHGAHSIAEIARHNLSKRAWIVLVAFIWVALLYVISAFTAVTADTFIGKSEELAGITGEFNRGGAVAAASTMYLLLALVMGVVQRIAKPNMWVTTLVFVPATLGIVWFGTQVSTILPGIAQGVCDAANGVLGLDAASGYTQATFWQVLILVYCFVASMLPLWLLQQPRGYLGGFVLYLAIGVGVVGILVGGLFGVPGAAAAATEGAAAAEPLASTALSIKQPMIAENIGSIPAWIAGGDDAPALTKLLFPFLFVTIACGACSGFHGLVCGGTTSRQIAKESHCKPIGFGAMLMEGFVAVIALATIMIVAPGTAQASAPPNEIYGSGLASFLLAILRESRETNPALYTFAVTFGTMAVATFIFDTLDVATRLGRYLLQELFGRTGRVSGAIAAGLTAGVPLVFLLTAQAGSWRVFWTLFGTSNQLLAALTLLGVTVWLRRTGRKSWYVFWPMVFVMTITVTALLLQIAQGVRAWGDSNSMLNAGVAIVLLALAGVFIAEAVVALRRISGAKPPAASSA
ncbi:MAG: carbon starvation CstA family protein [Phycisphaerales bacterium]